VRKKIKRFWGLVGGVYDLSEVEKAAIDSLVHWEEISAILKRHKGEYFKSGNQTSLPSYTLGTPTTIVLLENRSVVFEYFDFGDSYCSLCTLKRKAVQKYLANIPTTTAATTSTTSDTVSTPTTYATTSRTPLNTCIMFCPGAMLNGVTCDSRSDSTRKVGGKGPWRSFLDTVRFAEDSRVSDEMIEATKGVITWVSTVLKVIDVHKGSLGNVLGDNV
jgi:hypothetical protein